jgi:hypothetical protein
LALQFAGQRVRHDPQVDHPTVFRG